jgi:tetratricopeptide (TPR) repeat protein
MEVAFGKGNFEVCSFLKGLTKKEINLEEVAKPKEENKQQEPPNFEEFERIKKEGNALFEKGQNEGALQKYEEAESFNRTSAVIWTNMASCYLNMNKYQEALNCCEKSKLLDKNWAKAYYREG